jgi:hypothetical protein
MRRGSSRLHRKAAGMRKNLQESQDWDERYNCTGRPRKGEKQGPVRRRERTGGGMRRQKVQLQQVGSRRSCGLLAGRGSALLRGRDVDDLRRMRRMHAGGGNGPAAQARQRLGLAVVGPVAEAVAGTISRLPACMPQVVGYQEVRELVGEGGAHLCRRTGKPRQAAHDDGAHACVNACTRAAVHHVQSSAHGRRGARTWPLPSFRTCSEQYIAG